MIKNFDEVKRQLSELADVVNSYKSEAVQLRLVELVLGGAGPTGHADHAPDEGAADRPPARRRRTKPRSSGEQTQSQAPRQARSGRIGGKTALSRLYDEGYFGEAKTINDIVEHTATHLATRLKQSDFSGALARYVRDGKLKRSKNADSQFEYVQT